VYKLDYMHCVSGTKVLPSATVRLIVNGQVRQESSWGDGPVDAVYNAIKAVCGVEVELVTYSIQAVTSGTDAMGGVNIRIRSNGYVSNGHGSSTDIVEASARAYVDALNRLVAMRTRAGEHAEDVNGV